MFTSRFLENTNKQNLLIKTIDLASNATTIALIARKTQYKAIQFLKIDCDVILESLNEMRVDIFDL